MCPHVPVRLRRPCAEWLQISLVQVQTGPITAAVAGGMARAIILIDKSIVGYLDRHRLLASDSGPNLAQQQGQILAQISDFFGNWERNGLK